MHNKIKILYIAKMRYFILECASVRLKGIRLRGTAVRSVAKKAGEYLFKNSSKKMINFCLKETTKNSRHKSYNYRARISSSGIITLKTKKSNGGGTQFHTDDIVLLYNVKDGRYLSQYDINDESIYIDPNMKYDMGNVYGQSYNLVDRNYIDKNALWKVHKYKNTYVFSLLFPTSKYKHLNHKNFATLQYNRKDNNFIHTTETYFISDQKRYFTITENDEITDELRFCPYLDRLPPLQVIRVSLEDFLPSIRQLRNRETHNQSISRRQQTLAESIDSTTKGVSHR
jgi:hypothetical protein